MVTGCWLRPQPPFPLPVLLALRYSRRVAATVAGGAGGGVAEDGEPRASLLRTLPRPGAAARLAPGRTRSAGRAGRSRGLPCRHLPRLVSRSTLSCRVRPRAKAFGLRPGGLTPRRTPTRLGDARGPTYWQPDGPGLAAAGAGGGGGGWGPRVIIMHSARSFGLQLFSLANP